MGSLSTDTQHRLTIKTHARALIIAGGMVAALGVLSGCGPIVGGIGIVKAGIEVDAAKTAGAEKHAPYELSMAESYLQKAREEHGYAEFAGSRKFANKAYGYAHNARQKAASLSAADQEVTLPDENVGSITSSDTSSAGGF